MKGVLLRSPTDLKMEDIPTPRPRRHEVLVKVEACGICGSDYIYCVSLIFAEAHK